MAKVILIVLVNFIVLISFIQQAEIKEIENHKTKHMYSKTQYTNLNQYVNDLSHLIDEKNKQFKKNHHQ